MFAALLSSTCIVRAITPRQVRAVLQAAFRAYPRLGSVRDDTVYLKGWSASRANQILYTTTILCSAAGSPSERFPSEGPSTRRTKTRLKCPINRRMRRQRALRPRPHLVGGVDFYIYRACDRRCLERPDGRPRLKFGDKKKVLAALDTESGRCWLRMESMHKLQKI